MPTNNLEDVSTLEGEIVPADDALNKRVDIRQTDFDKFLLSAATPDGDGPAMDPHERIIAQVLAAETPDAVLTPVDAVQLRDLVGVNLLLYGFELNKSEFDVGSPFYASMQVERADSGDRTIANCGHKKVLAQLIKLGQFADDPNNSATWPYKVMAIERGNSKVGGTAMLELTKWVEIDSPPF